MTLGDYPRCTCGVPYWSPSPVPCPLHGYYTAPPPTTTLTATSATYRVCQGRHCAHDAKCNKSYTFNGA